MSPRASTQAPAAGTLPWRGPAADRPALALPPEPMPLVHARALRKRWRYVGVYSADLMLCAARASIGPFTQSFWAVWDRQARRSLDHTRLRPGGDEVRLDGPHVRIRARGLRADLVLGEGAPVEAICPSGRGWGWTEKRAGIAVKGTVELDGRSHTVDGLGVDDRSAGYHQRRTSWHWSAGIGEATDGRPVAWNLVQGINDPPRNSERGIWVDGDPYEPEPVAFNGLAGISFAGGGRLAFDSEAERARDENLIVFRSRYRHRFGTFAGSLGGIELADGLGVMEEHEARW